MGTERDTPTTARWWSRAEGKLPNPSKSSIIYLSSDPSGCVTTGTDNACSRRMALASATTTSIISIALKPRILYPRQLTSWICSRHCPSRDCAHSLASNCSSLWQNVGIWSCSRPGCAQFNLPPLLIHHAPPLQALEDRRANYVK